MKRLILVLLATAIATPALAQHSGHAAPPAPASEPSCTPEHAAMGHCQLPAQQQQPADPHAGHNMPAPQQPAPDPHAGHQMPAEPQPESVHPHAGHQMPAAPATAEPGPADPHAGHQMPQGPDPHAGHEMTEAPAPPVAPPPPEAFQGPENAADAVWGESAVRPSREFLLEKEHGGMATAKLFIDRAETRVRDGRDGYLLDAQGWYGGDIDKLWLKSEVEGAWGEKLEHAEVQALWSHAIGPWFDFQAGVRYDPQPGPNRSHLVLGVQGLAPYWWEVEGALFLSNKGDVTARAEAEYDLRVTQKLILQPRAEVDLSLQDVPELAIGSGLTNAALGLRLRYQISPLVAPYVGVEYERAFGDTRRFLSAEGEDPGGFNLVAGVRLWF